MPTLYLFKTPALHDPYEVLFKQQGWDVHFVPVLRFTFPFEAQVKKAFLDSESFSGLILTSLRGIQAIKAYGLDQSSLLRAWKNMPVFVVGPATHQAAESIGFFPTGDNSGNAEALARYIVQVHSGRKQPLLFLCAFNRRDELPALLSAAHIPFQECIAYKSHPVESNVVAGLEKPDLAVFFSPSGVHAMQSVWPVGWEDVSCAAIGGRTASVLKNLGWKLVATPDRPSPEGLVKTIKDAMPNLH